MTIKMEDGYGLIMYKNRGYKIYWLNEPYQIEFIESECKLTENPYLDLLVELEPKKLSQMCQTSFILVKYVQMMIYGRKRYLG